MTRGSEASFSLGFFNAVYREYFSRGQEPAKVTVQAPSPIDGIDIEVEVTAVVPS